MSRKGALAAAAPLVDGYVQSAERNGMLLFVKGTTKVYSGLLVAGQTLAITDSNRPEGLSDLECARILRDFGIPKYTELHTDLPLPVKVRKFRAT